MRPHVRHFFRLCTAVFAVTAASGIAAAEAPLADAVDATQKNRVNLLRLAVYLDRVSDQTTGETRTVITDLQAATRQHLLESLRTLIPELAAHHILRRSYPTRRPDNARRQSPNTSVQTFTLNALEESTPPTTGLWIQAFADSVEQDDRDGVEGFDSDGRGFTIGIDRSVSDNARAGVAYTRVTSDLTSNRFGQDGVTRHDYSAFSSLFFGRHAISMNLAYSQNETDRLRPIVVPTSDGLRAIGLFSRIDSTQWSTAVEYSMTFTPGFARVSPYVMLSRSVLETDDFVEQSSGEFALLVSTDDEKQLIASAGLRYSYDYFTENWIVSPGFVVAYHRDLIADDTGTFSRLRGSDLGFASTGFAVQDDRVNGGINLAIMHLDGFSAQLSLDLEVKDDYQYRGVILGAQYNF